MSKSMSETGTNALFTLLYGCPLVNTLTKTYSRISVLYDALYLRITSITTTMNTK